MPVAVLQAQKEAGRLLLPRVVSAAELRMWKRDYLRLLDAEKADVEKVAFFLWLSFRIPLTPVYSRDCQSFLQFCVVKATGD